MEKNYYERLTNNRKRFLDQLHNLIKNQFLAQENLSSEEISEDSEYVQRIFIDSPWGTGKTHFCKALIEEVKRNNDNLCNNKQIEIIKINAWESDYFSDPMKSLIGEITEQRAFGTVVSEKAEKLLAKVSIKIIVKIFKTALIKKLNLNNEDIEEIKSFFSGFNESELEEYKNYKKLIMDFKNDLANDKGKKVILIDELDRCKPTYAIELLETIKHIFGVKNIIFVFLVNKEQLKGTISVMYQPEDSYSEYLEKFFDLYFKLPEIDYLEFINKEYRELDDITSYNLTQEHGISTSNTQDLIYQKLFLDIVHYNYKNFEGIEKSPRNIQKIFKKYKIILSSLSSYEKSFYPLIVYLTVFTAVIEFKWEKKINVETLKPFFKELGESSMEYSFLAFFGGEKEFKLPNNLMTYKSIEHILLTGVKNNFFCLKKNINNRDINFNKLRIGDGSAEDNVLCLLMEAEIFNNIKIDKYKTPNGFYSKEMLLQWSEDKYNFVDFT